MGSHRQLAGFAMNHAVEFCPTRTGYIAHGPDLPGCAAAGRMLDETRELMRSAMREDGDPIREPSHTVDMPEVA